MNSAAERMRDGVIEILIDCPLNDNSTINDVQNWVEVLKALPDSEEKSTALTDAEKLLEKMNAVY